VKWLSIIHDGKREKNKLLKELYSNACFSTEPFAKPCLLRNLNSVSYISLKNKPILKAQKNTAFLRTLS